MHPCRLLPLSVTYAVAAAAGTVLVVGNPVVLVDARFVVSRVAACAIRLVARRGPVHRLRIVLMAIRALQVCTMILRLIRECCVTVIRRRPAVGGVADIALLRGAEMIRILPCRCNAIVAASARSQDLAVIHFQNRCKRVGCMAVLADIRCLHVSLVLASRVCAVVTAETVAGDIHVIKVRGHPANRTVTVIAVVATGDMSLVLARRGDAIVA